MSDLNKKGVRAAMQNFLNEPMPKGVGWLHTFGSVLLALIVVQLVTGILLSFYYSASAATAYESVKYIEEQVIMGSLLRGVHHFAASAMVIVLFLHIARTFFSGAYKAPRQWTWVAGVGLLTLILGFAFTGYLLPWDMKAYFATKVGVNIANMAPFIGAILLKVLQGGAEMSTITLSRFFALHVIALPLLLVGIVAFHLYQIRRWGETPPQLRNDEKVEFSSNFFPNQLARDSVAALLVIAIVFLLAYNPGAPLEPKADPNNTSYIPRPEWYFYGLFQLLKLFPGKLEVVGAIFLPTLFIGLLIGLPFLDKNPERKLSKRPFAKTSGSVVILSVLILTAWGAFDSGTTHRDVIKEVGSDKQPALAFQPDLNVGKIIYSELKCGECHDAGSTGRNIPPGLEFSGNKYKKEWLNSYLLSPFRIRWQGKDKRPLTRMPDFDLSSSEAMNLTAFLMSKKRSAMFIEPEFDWSEADSEMVHSGGELILEYGCSGCHRIADTGKNIGPNLTGVGNKLSGAYLFNIIKQPDILVPDTPMRNLQLDDMDIEDMTAYLRSLK